MSETPSQLPDLSNTKPIRSLLSKNRGDQRAMEMRFNGSTSQAIADDLGVSDETVRHWFAKDGRLYQPYEDLLASHLKPIRERIQEATHGALDSIIELSQGAKREQVKLQASADILDRAGYMPVQKMVNVNVIDEMSAEELDNFMVDLIGSVKERTSKAIDL